MNREVRRLLVQFVDGVAILTLAIICVQAHDAGASWLDVALDAALAALLSFWIEQTLWFLGQWR